jgi:hypothetical protein
MKKNIIKFASELDFIDVPRPAYKYFPEWFKKSNLYVVEGESKADSQKTFKHCMPFTDSLTSGYIQELWADIQVIQKDGKPVMYWKENGVSVISDKTPGAYGLMTPPIGYSTEMFGFMYSNYLKTPPGYSVLITQPFNRTDLPFYALTGIVDADIHPLYPGSYPIFIKEGFSGVIPKGTPILQILPFKRESWQSMEDKDLLIEGRLTRKIARSFLEFWYKKNAWSKKSYE